MRFSTAVRIADEGGVHTDVAHVVPVQARCGEVRLRFASRFCTDDDQQGNVVHATHS